LHDLLRLKKIGYDIDKISSFSKMLKWEHDQKKEKIHCEYYDLDVRGKLLMLKKGRQGCLFLKKDGLCHIHEVGILFCRAFPFWFVEKAERMKIIFDPCAEECPVAGAKNIARNNQIINGEKLKSGFYQLIGETEKGLLSLFRQFKKEMAAYEKYRFDLAKGEKPSEIIKKYKIKIN
jgi:Fe-S-cluster containining protein